MTVAFYVAAAVAIASTVAVITQLNAVHALLYLVVSLLSVAVMFFTLGAPFVAALEVIVYAGAIIVLFVFVVMILNLGPPAIAQERSWLATRAWVGPGILTMVLIGLFAYVLTGRGTDLGGAVVDPRQVGVALFSTYLLGVELASLLLLGALVGAYHLGRSRREIRAIEEIEAEVGGPEAGDATPKAVGPEAAPVGE